MSRDEWSSITKNNNINSKEMKKEGETIIFRFSLKQVDHFLGYLLL